MRTHGVIIGTIFFFNITFIFNAFLDYCTKCLKNFSYISCDPTKQTWVSELNRQLLLPSNTTDMEGLQRQQHHLTEKKSEDDEESIDDPDLAQKTMRKTHNRTMSDIPQFDNDAESTDSFSLDVSLEQDIVDVLQYLVDTICELEGSGVDKTEEDNSILQNKLETMSLRNAEEQSSR